MQHSFTDSRVTLRILEPYLFKDAASGEVHKASNGRINY
jgi:hypothetical protein